MAETGVLTHSGSAALACLAFADARSYSGAACARSPEGELGDVKVVPNGPFATWKHSASRAQVFKDATIGVFCDGNPEIRHDGVTLTALTPGGTADQAGIKAGDVILAINDHYLFTIRELQEEISHHEPGTKIRVRYRRYSSINEASVVVDAFSECKQKLNQFLLYGTHAQPIIPQLADNFEIVAHSRLSMFLY